MFATLFALVLGLQEPDTSVALPAGAAKSVFTNAQLIANATSEGDWDEASRLAARLPDLELSIDWDSSKLGKEQKLAFKEAMEKAVAQWTESLLGFKASFKNGAELKLSFVDTLPPNLDSPGPAAGVFLASPDKGDPVNEAVLALYRGVNKVSTEKTDVFNEVLYAIGDALGLERRPKPGSVMFRTEDPNFLANRITMSDVRLVNNVIEVSDQIRKLVSEKKPVKLVSAKIYIEPMKLEPTPVNQGDEMSVSLQITNRGSSVLEYRVVPDCSCFILGPHTREVAPGRSVIVPMYINTIDFTGQLHKALYVYSNDPEQSVRRIPMNTIVRPLFRFVSDYEGTTLIIDERGGTYEVVMVMEEDVEISRVSVEGLSAYVSYEPWEGELDNPEIGEGKKKRKGIKISALIAPDIPTGRVNMGIRVDTRHEVFKTLYHNLLVQRGIVPVPMSIYFGEIEQTTVRAHTIISRPNKPFKVLNVETDAKFLDVSVEPFSGDTGYKIVAIYNGKALPGRFFAKIKVKTDDPKQPVVEIPVEGTVL